MGGAAPRAGRPRLIDSGPPATRHGVGPRRRGPLPCVDPAVSNFFLAWPVPADPRFTAIPAPPPGLRCLHPDDLHVTLVFLGPVGLAAAERAWATLPAPVPRRVPLGPVRPMGHARRWSALAAHLGDALHADIAALRGPACAAAGVRPDPRPPLAHLTIARLRRSAGPADRDAALRWAATVDLVGDLTLAQLALYTWDEPRADRLFRIVHRAGSAPVPPGSDA